jgi:hypothetical protein
MTRWNPESEMGRNIAPLAKECRAEPVPPGAGWSSRSKDALLVFGFMVEPAKRGLIAKRCPQNI